MSNTEKVNQQGYITVSQYAEIKNISKQAVYQQIETTLKDQVIKLCGMKVLPLSVLTDEEKKKFQDFQVQIQENQGEFQEVQGKFQDFQGVSIQENQAEVQDFQGKVQDFQVSIQEIQAEEIIFLRKQIEEKDKQIASLTAQLESRNAIETQLAELIRNNQILLAQKSIPAEAEETAEKKKKGIFNIFRKNNG